MGPCEKAADDLKDESCSSKCAKALVPCVGTLCATAQPITVCRAMCAMATRIEAVDQPRASDYTPRQLCTLTTS